MAAGSAWRDALTEAELAELRRTDDLRGGLSVAFNWGLVAASLALVAWLPNVFVVVLAICVIGARQLGFAILMHEAAHRTLFETPALNEWVGNWLCAYPIWADLAPYRLYHLKHHAKNWTEEDPDLGLATKYPVTKASMRRKIWRDLSGQVGWKRAKAELARDLGQPEGTSTSATEVSFGKTAAEGTRAWENLRGVLITNAILLGILAALGHPELYGVWVAAWFTTYSLFTRIRSMAEHNMVRDRDDPLQNTRTILASWWERLFIAPNRVNYHLEHHLAMTVPLYNLPRLHRVLAERRALDGALIQHGYLDLIRAAASKPVSA